MKRKTIDTAREIRLWTGQIIIPAISIVLLVVSNDSIKKTLKKWKDR